MMSQTQMRDIAWMFRTSQGLFPDQFLVVNTYEVPFQIGMIFHRAWCAGGFRFRPLFSNSLPDSKSLLLLLPSYKVPIALLLDLEGESAKEATQLMQIPDIRSVTIDPTGLFNYMGEPLQADTKKIQDRAWSTSLTLHGASTKSFHQIHLPFSIQLDLLGSNGATHLIGLEVNNTFASVPGPIWYRIEGDPQGTLKVDLQPRAEGDVWDVNYIGERSQLYWSDDPRPNSSQSRTLEKLTVILDRTCPDKVAWSAARNLLMSTSVSQMKDEGDGYGGGSAVSPTDAEAQIAKVASPAQLNQEIRQGLAAALSHIAKDHKPLLDGLWFADVAGEGIAEPTTCSLPSEPIGRTVVGLSPSRAKEMFQASVYSPGLDLWDPLEQALKEAVEGMQQAQHQGILIVGNSPPRPSLNSQSPLNQIASALGFMTSYRKRSDDWDYYLAQCTSRCIPIVYLFLTHELSEAELEKGVLKDYERFLNIQSHLQRALSTYLPTLVYPATEQGVAEGVREALELLQRPSRSWSTVGFIEGSQSFGTPSS